MPLFFMVLLLGAAYLTVSNLILPGMEKNWKASSTSATVARAGAIAAATTAQAFLKIAFLVFGAALLLLTILSLLAPSPGGSALVVLHGFLRALETTAKGLREGIGLIVSWVAFIGLSYLMFDLRRDGLRARLQAERERQLKELRAKQSRGKLPKLPPTKEMKEISEHLRSLSAARPGRRGAGGEGAGSIQVLKGKLAHLDLERRVDLTGIRIFEPGGSGRWGWLHMALFSRGTHRSFSFLSKNAGRAATATACLLTIGIGAPALAGLAIEPALSRVTDIQVYHSDDSALASLKAMAAAPPQTPETPEEDARLYRIAAQQFVRALNHSQHWHSGPARLLSQPAPPAAAAKPDLVEELAIRDTILQDYASSVAQAEWRVEPVSVARSEAVTPETRQRYEGLRKSIAANALRGAGDEPVERVARWFRWEAARSQTFKERLAAGVASFREPATAWDYASTVIGDNLSAAIKEGLPDPAAVGLFEKRAAATGRKALESAAERLVRIKLAAFLRGLSTAQSYGDALAAVRSPDGAPPFRRGEARQVQALVAAAADDRALLAKAVEADPPALARRTSDAERKFARQTVERLRRASLLPDKATEMQRALEGALGTYEDFFPAQERMVAQTAFSEATFSSGFPGLDLPGAGIPDRPSRAQASRNFKSLRLSSRVGGVLIGSDPEATSVDYRQLAWSRDGKGLRLAILDAEGRSTGLGTYSGAMIQQALAYAADGRPTAVTMVSGQLTGKILRVHLHPALVDTPLGNAMIELDRFVDEATNDLAPREPWETRVRGQLHLYRHAARLRDLRARSGGRISLGATEPARAKTRQIVEQSFPAQWRLENPDESIFARFPLSFDLDMVRRFRSCKPSLAVTEADYWDCVIGPSLGRAGFEIPPESDIWSGVREAPYALTAAAAASALSDTGTKRPLRFMLGVAFQDDGETRPCDTRGCAFGASAEPWEFPVIASGIENMTLEWVDGDPRKRQILADAQTFTLLQRLFRAALRGHLGPAFSRTGLVALMSAARQVERVRSTPTPNWSQGRSFALATLRCSTSRQPMDDRSKRRAAFLSLLLKAEDVRFTPEPRGTSAASHACEDVL
jgi:hypothetical protein